jgi:hypothetical protein
MMEQQHSNTSQHMVRSQLHPATRPSTPTLQVQPATFSPHLPPASTPPCPAARARSRPALGSSLALVPAPALSSAAPPPPPLAPTAAPPGRPLPGPSPSPGAGLPMPPAAMAPAPAAACTWPAAGLVPMAGSFILLSPEPDQNSSCRAERGRRCRKDAGCRCRPLHSEELCKAGLTVQRRRRHCSAGAGRGEAASQCDTEASSAGPPWPSAAARCSHPRPSPAPEPKQGSRQGRCPLAALQRRHALHGRGALRRARLPAVHAGPPGCSGR